jgi:hypothetical protein
LAVEQTQLIFAVYDASYQRFSFAAIREAISQELGFAVLEEQLEYTPFFVLE